MDDLKISHESEKVVREIISMIEAEYGEMTVTVGREHTYCGMNLSFNENGTLSVEMKSFLEEALEEFPDDTSKRSNTPAATHLFKVNNKKEEINA